MTANAELESIDGVGPEVAQHVVTFFADADNRAAIARMRDAGVELKNPSAGGAQQLDGLTFVFTGGLEHWTRDAVKRLVERHGGRATSSVSGNTDYVIAGSNPGTKIDEAAANDVPVWDEATFIGFLRDKNVDVDSME